MPTTKDACLWKATTFVLFALSKSTRLQNGEFDSSTPVYGDVFMAKGSESRQDMSGETVYMDVPEEYLSENSLI